LLASNSKDSISNVCAELKEIDVKVEDDIINLLDKFNLSDSFSKYISENIDTIYFEMTENEIEGLHELLKLPYYHGVTEEIFELNLV
jgi:hypothetical protein